MEIQTMPQTRRIKGLLISPKFFELLLFPTVQKMQIINKAIPEGSALVGAAFDSFNQHFITYWEHPSFEPIPIYETIPMIPSSDISFTRLD